MIHAPSLQASGGLDTYIQVPVSESRASQIQGRQFNAGLSLSVTDLVPCLGTLSYNIFHKDFSAFSVNVCVDPMSFL